jgi:tRNA-binding EMAP/Myf-like protein
MTEPQKTIQFEDFAKMDIRTGTILEEKKCNKQTFNFENRHRN